jgi:CO/xanthine dehydrogenase FAD-binding subunit
MTASFTSATSLDEAIAAIAAGARPVAGGTDLVVGARQGKAPLPDAIVAIDGIDSLRHLDDPGGGLRLGALVTHEDIVASEAVRSTFTALADASAIVGSHATRANGTIGGNVMNASPAMDTGGPLLCLGASVTLRSSAGERSISLDELWTGPGATSAAPGELLVSIDVPAPADGSGSAYVRLEYRRQMEIAVVGATAMITLAGGAVSDARVAITALAPTIRRVTEAEQALVGGDGGDADVATAARATADYRSAMAEVVARRAIAAAITRAGGGDVPIPASDALYGA